ncbi:hypothetical protein NON20_20810 [Synechocystis sp. B12]|nr:hypothetical protein NON20_20810 [Synechocystis sp. B12]
MLIPQELQNKLGSNIDLIYADSFFCQHYLIKLGLDLTRTILEVDRFHTYDDALRQRKEIVYQDFQWELDQLKLFGVLLITTEPLAFKLQELQPQTRIYSLKTNGQGLDYEHLNQAFTDILGEKLLSATNNKNVVKKVVMLYPWGIWKSGVVEPVSGLEKWQIFLPVKA